MSVFERYTPQSADDVLQEKLTSASVVISKVHPIMKGRLVRGFEKWEKEFPNVDLRILSAARTYAQQAYLRKIYGSPRAANPDYSRGPDFEGIEVKGSLHQVKGRPGQAQYGWAVDFQRPSVGWEPVWRIFEKQGIVFVLRKLGGRAREEWHATVRGMNGWYPGPFPEVPGVWRKLYQNDIGEDVKALQRQLGDLTVDGHFGNATRRRVLAVQVDMGFKEDGNWGSSDQRRWDAAQEPEAKPLPRIVIPDEAAVKAVLKVARSDVDAIVGDNSAEQIKSSTGLLRKRFDQIERIVSD